MQRPSSLRFLILLPLITFSQARNHDWGINCKGSSQCNRISISTNFHNIIDAFDWLVNNGSLTGLPGGPLNPDLIIPPDENIACVENNVGEKGSICMFTGGNVPSTGISAATIGLRISDLNYHGCEMCGSVPISGDNNPDEEGVLTVNYVDQKNCNGICQGIYPAAGTS